LSCQITIVTQTVSLRSRSDPAVQLRTTDQSGDLQLLYFVPVGEAAAWDAAGEATGAVVAAGDATGAGVGVASGAVDCNTEWEPVTPGSESINAKSIKPAAAPIVIFERMLAVPRGPNAVLDTLLENRSPAPDFPGCNSTTITKTTQDRINSPYKV
jgi:hypothetical protein